MTSFRTRLAEVQLAVMLLTRLPAVRMAEAPAIGAAVWAFPLVGTLVGAIGATVLGGALALGIAPPLAAGLALAAGILTTGGLHEDGLADVADGFGGGRDRARKLEIMRDSRIGSYGGVALILSLGLRWQALAILVGHDPKLAACALIALAISSRAGLAFALLWMPAARADGMGKSATGTTLARALAGFALAVLGMAVLIGPQAAVLVFSTQIVVQLIFARIALRQIGGQSGDVLGAMQQLAEIAGWLVLAR
ncbi:MAG: adenosylcobinamide-GDP ribazoletransferase [Cypionkella sp.]|uniref:adenosylcobinamide-GDP ribazoletransferase n=1 Tax=Cypionkella sp. TaxID=2811411 RepID=UPI002ABA3188|nr:adenosylcobinamide-GDP ribazoletransferase [Cypionkella sp.]MDZ4311120.1 adenosylcobinamide-GDP ribazoletransferase [Cypionkella sp.]